MNWEGFDRARRKFEEHMDACRRCQESPMDLCPRGDRLLRDAVAQVDPMGTSGTGSQ